MFIDLTGMRFGRLVVIKRVANGIRRSLRWLCRCDCGKETIVFGDSLKQGKTKSCGCLARERAKSVNTKHGLHGTKIYKTWASIIQRCTNPNCKDYKYYGERKITLCDRWNPKNGGSFRNFLEDVEEIPKDLTFDRINSEGNYEINNWKLSTRKEQMRNIRKNIIITFNGITKLLIKFSEEYKIPYDTLYYRIRIAFWPIEKALLTPVKKYKRKR